jgi:hypothetical protein
MAYCDYSVYLKRSEMSPGAANMELSTSPNVRQVRKKGPAPRPAYTVGGAYLQYERSIDMVLIYLWVEDVYKLKAFNKLKIVRGRKRRSGHLCSLPNKPPATEMKIKNTLDISYSFNPYF